MKDSQTNKSESLAESVKENKKEEDSQYAIDKEMMEEELCGEYDNDQSEAILVVEKPLTKA